MFFVAAVAAFTTTAAISDWRTRKLPNWLTVSALLVALLMHTVVHGFAGLTFSLLGFATGFGFLLVLWLTGGGGGGDVKLMGALGAWMGAGLTLHVLVISTALAASATGVVLLARTAGRGFGYVRRRYLAAGATGALPTHASAEQRKEFDRQQRQRRRVMPFAVPVAIGTWVVLATNLGKLPW